MNIITRKNKDTGIEEQYLLTKGVLQNIETTSKTTKENGKPYGFFTAKVAGKVATGIAYDNVVQNVGRDNFFPGAEIQVEALLSDVKSGHNNRWKIALTSAEDISSDITDFIAKL